MVQINDLVLRPGKSVPEMLSIGDTLISIDGAQLGQVLRVLSIWIPSHRTRWPAQHSLHVLLECSASDARIA